MSKEKDLSSPDAKAPEVRIENDLQAFIAENKSLYEGWITLAEQPRLDDGGIVAGKADMT